MLYKTEVSDFETLLEKDNAVTIHVKNLQLLMAEIFKTQHTLNLTFLKETLVSKSNSHPRVL